MIFCSCIHYISISTFQCCVESIHIVVINSMTKLSKFADLHASTSTYRFS